MDTVTMNETVVLTQFFDLSLDLMSVTGLDGYFKRLNPVWERTVGFTREELQAKPFLEFVHPDDREATATEAAKLGQGVDTLSFENRYMCKDGGYRWLHWTATMSFEYQAIYAIAHDITAQKQAEAEREQLLNNLEKVVAERTAELQQRQELLTTVLDATPQTIFWKDRDSVYLGCNEQFARMAGTAKAADIVGKNDLDMPWHAETDAYRADDKAVMDSNIPKYHIIETIIDATGQQSWIDTTKVPLCDKAGHVFGVLGVFEDITARKKAEQDLYLMKFLVEQSVDSIALANLDGVILYANPAWAKMHGYDNEATLVGQHLSIFHTEEQLQREVLPYLARLHEKGADVCEIGHVTRDGRVVPTLMSVTYLRDQEGKLIGQVGIARDITDVKQAEQSLREMKQRLELAIEGANDGLWDWVDINNTYSWWSPRLYELFGYENGEIESSTTKFGELIHPDDREAVFANLNDCLVGLHLYDIECRVKMKSGEYRWFRSRGQALRDKTGQAIRVAGSTQDIHDRKQMENEIRRWASVFEHAEWGVAVSSTDGKTVSLVNPAFARMHGATVEELINKPVVELFPPESRAGLLDNIRLAHEKGHHAFESKNIRKDGTIFPVLVDVTTVKNEDGSFRYQVVNLQDITERKQAEAERERLQQEVIEAQQRVIQELSTPIIPITNGVIVMPLIGSIDSMRSRDIMQNLLKGIREHRAKIVILDITGVPIVDTGVVAHLDKTIQAARLKGARTIVTGISDSVAESLVDLGIDWSNVETLRDLQTGLVVALNRLGIKLSQKDGQKL